MHDERRHLQLAFLVHDLRALTVLDDERPRHQSSTRTSSRPHSSQRSSSSGADAATRAAETNRELMDRAQELQELIDGFRNEDGTINRSAD